MGDQGGEFSFFPDIYESIDIRIDISISIRLMTTKCGKQGSESNETNHSLSDSHQPTKKSPPGKFPIPPTP